MEFNNKGYDIWYYSYARIIIKDYCVKVLTNWGWNNNFELLTNPVC